ncbi:hypothetical protein B0A69_09970 [Chryseobacterium shigense]|nr:hypothetical protein B0A69_09970 [Chryseobacterium shigense]
MYDNISICFQLKAQEEYKNTEFIEGLWSEFTGSVTAALLYVLKTKNPLLTEVTEGFSTPGGT